jgi:hypothetical protein
MKFENELRLSKVREIITNLDKILTIENKKYLPKYFTDAELMQKAVDRIQDVICRDEPIMLAKIELD